MAAVREDKERKIVVAVDEGEESMYALSWCLNNVICDNSKHTLILLYVKPPRVLYTALDGTGYLFSSDIIATMEKYSKDVADCVIEKAKKLCSETENDLQNVKVETKVESGDPRDVICEMAEKLSADMLVMGNHGYGLIKRAFLGSVSNHCAQNVKCPVLIVKRPKSTAGNNS
ncbi:PREDICTED: universal stress protein A-like protein [Nelumbo nucifera]|uniref:Universal stress protein A-like protein n=1 Tax=Nelumbo nucifera TaxID=4432 RepID=A0A1U8AXG3_NELNU|nr:PREDICTED: universal stress protein A-like protein [Nelumbo nucifera]